MFSNSYHLLTKTCTLWYRLFSHFFVNMQNSVTKTHNLVTYWRHFYYPDTHYRNSFNNATQLQFKCKSVAEAVSVVSLHELHDISEPRKSIRIFSKTNSSDWQANSSSRPFYFITLAVLLCQADNCPLT